MSKVYMCELYKIKKDFIYKKFRPFINCKLNDYEIENNNDLIFNSLKEKGLSYQEIIKNNDMLLDKIFLKSTIIPGIYKEIITGKTFIIPHLESSGYYITGFYDIKPYILLEKNMIDITNKDTDLETLTYYKKCLESYINNKDIVKKIIEKIEKYEKDINKIYDEKIKEYYNYKKMENIVREKLKEKEKEDREKLIKNIKKISTSK